MGDVNRYVVQVSSNDIEVNLHRKDIESSFMTGEALYSTKHPWTLKTHIELSMGYESLNANLRLVLLTGVSK